MPTRLVMAAFRGAVVVGSAAATLLGVAAPPASAVEAHLIKLCAKENYTGYVRLANHPDVYFIDAPGGSCSYQSLSGSWSSASQPVDIGLYDDFGLSGIRFEKFETRSMPGLTESGYYVELTGTASKPRISTHQ